MLISTVIVFFILYFLLNRMAIKYGLYDKNEFKKNNLIKIPLIGGVCIFVTLIIISSFFSIKDDTYLMILLSFGIFVMGFLDDSLNLNFKLRFLIQIIFVSFYVIFFKLIITNYGFFNINKNFLFLSLFFTILAIVGTVNAFNFIDGLDGLTSSLFIVAIIFIKIFVFVNNDNYFFDELDILLVSVFCFLLINKQFIKFGKIYLGDSGSMFLGFIVSIYLIYYSNVYTYIPSSIVFWFVAVPIYDFFAVILIRILNKKNPMVGDNQHFHHVLLNKGYSENFVLIFLVSLSVLFSLFGILVNKLTNDITSILFFISILIFYLFYRIKDIKNHSPI